MLNNFKIIIIVIYIEKETKSITFDNKRKDEEMINKYVKNSIYFDFLFDFSQPAFSFISESRVLFFHVSDFDDRISLLDISFC